MVGEDVLFLTVRELGERIKSSALSPVELTQSYLDRGRKYGPRLNAYATMTDDLALKQAKAAEEEIAAGKYRGPLHGIPYAAKDLLAVSGYPTTWGAKPYANQKFNFDATVIRKLNDAGAVLLGKAAMIELAGGMGYRYASASLQGPAKNPWNAGCWTCGSSSGSGAIVSGALAAFALGTETWGSIICPSGFCGISGLRPTFGRVSRYGAMALAYSMDKIGPMARSAEDCALILSVISGHNDKDLGSVSEAQAKFDASVPVPSPLRIGWLTNQWKKPDADVEQAAWAAVQTLHQHGASLQEVKLPEGPWEQAAGLVVSGEGASAFYDLISSGKVSELADPLGRVGCYVSLTIPATDLIAANRIRTVLQKRMDEAFEGVDVLASASLPTTASTLETNLETALSFSDPIGGIGNLLGLPAISVPCGLSAKKLPIGVQFIGRAGDDASVIAAAKLFQAHSDFHKLRPPMA